MAAKRTFGLRPLQIGARGHDVRVLQDFLTRWGVKTGIDGQYGPVTTLRVKLWETLTGRPVDGRMSVEDAAELRRAVEAGEHRPAVAPAAEGAVSGGTAPETAAAAVPAAPAAPVAT